MCYNGAAIQQELKQIYSWLIKGDSRPSKGRLSQISIMEREWSGFLSGKWT